MEKMGSRIRIARSHANRMTQATLARLIGVSREAVSLWESDTNAPTADKIGEIARLTGTRADWIWMGTGPMADKYAHLFMESEIQERALGHKRSKNP